MSSETPLREPWASFLSDLDSQLALPTELHCLGGFVVSELYGLERPTADVDILGATKGTDAATLASLAGKGSPLQKRHKVYLDVVTGLRPLGAWTRESCAIGTSLSSGRCLVGPTVRT